MQYPADDITSSWRTTHFDYHSFEDNLFLVFGKESVGLPKCIVENYPEKLYKIPIYNKEVRSLNLANAVGIVVYEGLRQLQ